jgi:hypothetical protein
MKKLVITFGIVMLFIFTGLVSASITIPIKSTTDIGDQGVFFAELGRRGNDGTITSLNGEYHVRNRFIGISGLATNGNAEGRFRGGFRGNNFFIQIPIRGQSLTIFGRLRLNEDNQFQGVWIGRGIPVRGRITGSFTPTE